MWEPDLYKPERFVVLWLMVKMQLADWEPNQRMKSCLSEVGVVLKLVCSIVLRILQAIVEAILVKRS